MKLVLYLRLSVVFALLLLLYYIYKVGNYQFKITIKHREEERRNRISQHDQNRNMIVVVVACGDRLQETLTMIKSAVMFTRTDVMFIVITEDALIDSFEEKLSEWQKIVHNTFTFKVLPLMFPMANAHEWKRLFKPCAAQRLFLPSVLNDVDSILYVDTDTLFMTSVTALWEHFGKMNSSQMAALAPEHEDSNIGWYNRFARHPFYGNLGVNSGVMLMNLTKMREFQWVDYVVPIYRKYKLKITWGDQDIINIIFHFHPDKLYIYSCLYNFRPDHCMYMNVCKGVEEYGIVVLHGSRGFFHSEKQPAFQAVYRAFDEFQLGGDLYHDFYLPLETYVELTSETNCGHIKNAYLRNVVKNIDREG